MTARADRGPIALSGTARGILLMIAAMLFFTLMDAVAKGLARSHDPLMVTWARYAGQTGWSFLLLAPWLPRLLRTRHPGLQLLRSALLFGATFCFYTSLSALPLAKATAIFEVQPLIVTALAVLILKDRVGPRRWLGVGVGMAGALIIIRPGTEVFTPYSLLPVAAAACFSGYAIATRHLGNSESPWTSFVYTALIGTIGASIMVAPVWSVPEGRDLWLMAGIGVIGGIGQLLLILSLIAASPSITAPFSYLSLVFASIWGYVFFDEWPDAPVWAGAGLIVGSGLYVWYRENRAAARAKSGGDA